MRAALKHKKHKTLLIVFIIDVKHQKKDKKNHKLKSLLRNLKLINRFSDIIANKKKTLLNVITVMCVCVYKCDKSQNQTIKKKKSRSSYNELCDRLLS